MKRALVPLGTFVTRRAFSLVEVVLSIGIVAFCLFALLGLFSVGAQASHDSSEMVQAATVASLMVSERRAAPTNSTGPMTNCPIYPLTNTMSVSNIYVASNCTTNASSQASLPMYRLTYNVTTNADNSASLYFCMTWPAVIDPIANPTLVKGRYEVFTCIPLSLP